MCGIYLITNTTTNKVYIGQSIQIERRWSEHKARAFNSNTNCYDSPLYRSIRKHGVDAFVLSVICECEPEQLNEIVLVQKVIMFKSQNRYVRQYTANERVKIVENQLVILRSISYVESVILLLPVSLIDLPRKS